MPPGRISVYCRVRPSAENSGDQLELLPDKRTIQIVRPSRKNVPGVCNHEEIQHTFTLDGVFTNRCASQESIYAATADQLVEQSALAGRNATLMCYGPLHSGKGYTLFGRDDYPSRGIAPRAIQQLYKGIEAVKKDRTYEVTVTFLELRGEQLIDLLCAEKQVIGHSKSSEKAVVTVDARGAVVLRGVTRRACADEAQALAVMFDGLNNYRRTRRDGESHLVLSLSICSKSLQDSEACSRQSCFHLVYLAGTQRTEAVRAHDQRVEMQQINRSLSMLEQVALSLSGTSGAGERRHVPYRQSKLTTLLKDCIGGGAHTALIAHIHPGDGRVEQTLATLGFAKRMMRVPTDPIVNVVLDADAQVRVLRREVADLKAELRLQAQLDRRQKDFSSGAGTPPNPGAGIASAYDAEELRLIQEDVRAFIEGSTPTIAVNSIREMHTCFSYLRTLVEERDTELATLKSALKAATAATATDQAVATGRTERKSASRAGTSSILSRDNAKASQSSASETCDACTPSALDRSSGIGYGTSSKPNYKAIRSNSVLHKHTPAPAAPNNTTHVMYYVTPVAQPKGPVVRSGVPVSGGLPSNSAGSGALLEVTDRAGNKGVAKPKRPRDGSAAATTSANLHPLNDEKGSYNKVSDNDVSPVEKDVPPAMENPFSRTVAKVVDYEEPPRPHTQPSFSQRARSPSTHRVMLAVHRSNANAVADVETDLPGHHLYANDMTAFTKADAFEMYKQIHGGALQLRALDVDQRRLDEMDREIASLQRHVGVGEQELLRTERREAHSNDNRYGAILRYAAASSAKEPHPPSLESRLNGTSLLNLSADDVEGDRRGYLNEADFSLLSHVQLSAYLHQQKAVLGQTQSDRAHLVKQLERRRMAFLRNFDLWYHQQYGHHATTTSLIQPMEGKNSFIRSVPTSQRPSTADVLHSRAHLPRSHLGKILPDLRVASPSRVILSVGASSSVHQNSSCVADELVGEVGCHPLPFNEDPFLDSSERLSVMELQRQVALDPDSVAFMEGRRLAAGGCATGASRRT